ncbi:MAG TPA: V-type ATP synthase subunit K [Candidatus Aminicenantes bacterium]|nr:V-type ATP synthase subunit K [Candidatus Aminicenantes bacterium]
MNLSQIGIGAVCALSAVGSGIGAGVAGMAAIGAWKKCFAQNKPAPFMMIAFVGAPLTQTVYGFILMNALKAARARLDPGFLLGVGVFAGLAMGVSALYQGMAGASAADAFADTGKGFGNYIMVIGLIETVALFIMVFMLGIIG